MKRTGVTYADVLLLSARGETSGPSQGRVCQWVGHIQQDESSVFLCPSLRVSSCAKSRVLWHLDFLLYQPELPRATYRRIWQTAGNTPRRAEQYVQLTISGESNFRPVANHIPFSLVNCPQNPLPRRVLGIVLPLLNKRS